MSFFESHTQFIHFMDTLLFNVIILAFMIFVDIHFKELDKKIKDLKKIMEKDQTNEERNNVKEENKEIVI